MQNGIPSFLFLSFEKRRKIEYEVVFRPFTNPRQKEQTTRHFTSFSTEQTHSCVHISELRQSISPAYLRVNRRHDVSIMLLHSQAEALMSNDANKEALASLADLEMELRGLRPPESNMMTSPGQTDEASSEEWTDEETGEKLRDLTSLAVWSVSTAKPGNGVEQLLDGKQKTYWQSDGPQPHTISAQFVSKLKVKEVRVFLDFGSDESYTPSVISVRAGTNFHDLKLVRKIKELSGPHGWVRIPLGDLPFEGDALEGDDEDEDSSDGEEDEIHERSAADLAARDMRRHARATSRKKSEMARSRAMQEARAKLEGGSLRDRSVTKAHMIQIVIHCNHQNGRDSHIRMVRVLGAKRQVTGISSRFTSREFQMYDTIR